MKLKGVFVLFIMFFVLVGGVSAEDNFLIFQFFI